MPASPYRTALVTGASSGIGAALASCLGAAGVEVVLAARRTDVLDELAKAIEGAGGKARVAAIDVTDPEATVATIRRMDEEVDGLDLVVANAGVAEGRWSGKLEWSDCASTIAINIAGATATLVAALPRMVERKRGHVVGISSIAAYRSVPKLAAYSGSKAYLSAFLGTLRADLRGTGVAVTDVRPGYVKTAMNEGTKAPFMLTADQAAAAIWRAIRARRSVYAFPFVTAAVMRTATLLPNALYDRIAAGR